MPARTDPPCLMLHRPTIVLVAVCLMLVMARAAGTPSPVSMAAWSGPPGSPAVLPYPPHSGPLADYLLLLEGEPLGLRSERHLEMQREGSSARRLDDGRPAARAWLAALHREQDAALARLPERIGRLPRILDRFSHALNGISLPLTVEEADRLRDLPGLRSIHRLGRAELATDAGPAWSGAAGLWDGSALSRPEGVRGEGIVVAIIDTGIHSAHPSFAEVDAEGYRHRSPRSGFLGWCDPAHRRHQLLVGACNAKLIGMWSHERASFDVQDENGHGTHVAGIAAGNRLRDMAFGRTLELRADLSGMAPRASLAVYDACDGTVCMDAASLPAIEEALRDGVDVINYSITVGDASPWQSPHDLAFLSARAAGVFVSAAAGNAGPEPSSLTSIAPWVATVAKGSHDRFFEASLVDLVGGPAPLPGLTGHALTGGFGPAPIVDARGRVNRSSARDDGRCLEAFAPGSLTGAIVVCRRGENGRLEKGANVLAGGAGGMVLVNEAAHGPSLATDAHLLPAVHLGQDEGDRLLSWLSAGAGHRARITPSRPQRSAAEGDRLDRSSSRGPARYQACCRHPRLPASYPAPLDLLKPDLAAPGTDVLAAQAAGMAPRSPELGLLGGTSMASPFVAGAAALLRQARPAWTASEIHGALVSTTRPGLTKAAGAPATAIEGGAGSLDAAAAAATGLVLDETGTGFLDRDPDQGGDPSRLNLAGLVAADCPGLCDWQRRLRSVTERDTTWTLRPMAPEGSLLRVEPQRFRLAPGESVTLTITAEVSRLPEGGWVDGAIWIEPEDGRSSPVRLSLALRPVAARLPRQIYLESLAEPSSAGLTGLEAPRAQAPEAHVHGLREPRIERVTIGQAPRGADPFTVPTGTITLELEVPAGSSRLLAAVASAEARDLDLWLGRDADGDGQAEPEEIACASASPLLLERCDLLDPEPGRWWILLQNLRAAGTADRVELETLVLAPEDAGNLQARLLPADEGSWQLGLDWDLPRLQVDRSWYGSLELRDPEGPRALLGRIPIEIRGVRALSTPTRTPTRAPSPTPGATASATAGGTAERPGPTGPLHLPILTRNR